jgi:hypothetical protein
MVAYTLPDPSSAVAFEYERESHDDLRTVVMHCRPNEDAPGWRQLPCPVDDNYLGRFCTGAGPVLEAGLT